MIDGKVVPVQRENWQGQAPWVHLPFAFQSYEEVDYALDKMEPIFRKQIEAQGFVVLGWVEVGFAYLMSTEPIASLADLSGKKQIELMRAIKGIFDPTGILNPGKSF